MPETEKDVPPRNPEQDCAACGWRSRAAAPALCPACGKPMPDAAIPPEPTCHPTCVDHDDLFERPCSDCPVLPPEEVTRD